MFFFFVDGIFCTFRLSVLLLSRNWTVFPAADPHLELRSGGVGGGGGGGWGLERS